jgi:hypothetical protein
LLPFGALVSQSGAHGRPADRASTVTYASAFRRGSSWARNHTITGVHSGAVTGVACSAGVNVPGASVSPTAAATVAAHATSATIRGKRPRKGRQAFTTRLSTSPAAGPRGPLVRWTFR